MSPSKVLFFLCCICFVSIMLWCPPLQAQPSVIAEAQRARLTYFRTQVTPVIAQQRRRLEQALSRPDRLLVESVQEQLTALAQLGVRLTTPLPNGTKRTLSAAEQQQRDQLPQRVNQTLARLDPLLTKHQVLLADIRHHLLPHRARWLSEIAHLPPLPEQGPKTDQQLIDHQLRPASLLLSAAGGKTK